MKEQEKRYPQVGVGALIIDKEENVFLVLRRRPPEAGCWSIPGGRVEFMETIEDAIRREVKEELGIEVKVREFLTVTDHIIKEENAHWVSPAFLVEMKAGELENLAPEETQECRWFSLKNLPENITLTARSAIDVYLRKNRG